MLRGHGHDVVRAEEFGQQRADDAEILEKARKQDRTLLTVDEHFGDWTVLPLSQHPGVIRLRAHPSVSNLISEILLPFLERHRQSQFRNCLIILSRSRERWIKTYP